MKREYILLPKNPGVTYYTDKENLFKSDWIDAEDKENNKVKVRLENYIVISNR